ncbi:hypothetical protein Mpsy_1255 [Methanolobus psychrophilus R15]|nr:hypothetical protein Mpsy_1255 [Methanolobus psychrophilus R15]
MWQRHAGVAAHHLLHLPGVQPGRRQAASSMLCRNPALYSPNSRMRFGLLTRK